MHSQTNQPRPEPRTCRRWFEHKTITPTTKVSTTSELPVRFEWRYTGTRVSTGAPMAEANAEHTDSPTLVTFRSSIALAPLSGHSSFLLKKRVRQAGANPT
jgi:hypothetical protein